VFGIVQYTSSDAVVAVFEGPASRVIRGWLGLLSTQRASDCPW